MILRNMTNKTSHPTCPPFISVSRQSHHLVISLQVPEEEEENEESLAHGDHSKNKTEA